LKDGLHITIESRLISFYWVGFVFLKNDFLPVWLD